MIREMLAFGVGVLVGFVAGAAAMWATLRPAFEGARVRADVAEDRVRVLLLDRKSERPIVGGPLV